MSTIADLTTPQKVLQHVAITETAMQKAAALFTEVDRVKAAVAPLADKAAAVMVQFERARPDQQAKLAAQLRDPVQALEYLISVAGHRNAAELNQLGAGVAPQGTAKQASHNPANSIHKPNPGAPTTQLQQSDITLFTKLGLRVPGT